MDHSPLNPTRISSVRSFNAASFPLIHHHFLNGSLGPLGTHLLASHPSLPCLAHPPLHQPALLPLPDSKPIPALAPAKRTATTTRFNQQQRQRKSRPSEKKLNNGKAILVAAKKSKEERWEEEEQEDIMESIYSISPPPSSLPLPRFSVPRPKPAVPAASCVMEAVESGGIDIGATDGLRRLLRL